MKSRIKWLIEKIDENISFNTNILKYIYIYLNNNFIEVVGKKIIILADVNLLHNCVKFNLFLS